MSATSTTTTVEVENEYQKIILVNEMLGQISDGQWENAAPRNHYESFRGIRWSNVGIAPHARGPITFHPQRNYAFNNKSLLEAVGDRIRFNLNLYELATDKDVILRYFEAESEGEVYGPDDANEFISCSGAPAAGSSYDAKRYAAYVMLYEAGITLELAKQAEIGPHDRKFVTQQCTRLQRLINEKSWVTDSWKMRNGIPAHMSISDWKASRKPARKATSDLTTHINVTVEFNVNLTAYMAEYGLTSPAEATAQIRELVRTAGTAELKANGFVI